MYYAEPPPPPPPPPSQTALGVLVDAGEIHFRGEVVEFYVSVSSSGEPVDADIEATLYFGGAIHDDLSFEVERIDCGLYRIPYTIAADASTGTYALFVKANQESSSGVSLKTFLLSPTLTGWNAQLVNINGSIGTIKTDLGLIKVDLNSVNAKLTALSNTVATIETDIGTLSTDIANLQLKIIAMNGTLVTSKRHWAPLTEK